MSVRILLTGVVVAALCAPALALAQDELEDDLLAPLTPGEAPKPKKKKKEKAPRQSIPDDDLVAPLKAPTELVVSMAENIQGARLFIDGKEVGEINGTPFDVTPGEHKILVKRVGFNDFVGLVAVPNEGRESVTVSLFPNGGVLAVQPNVPAADVYVDGKLIGKGPIKDLVLKPGSYEVRVSKAGYSAEVSRLSIRNGKDYVLTPTLMPALTPDRPEKPRTDPVVASSSGVNPAATQTGSSTALSTGSPWYGQWYVWAGAAAVVAAAGAGTYAAMNTGPGPWSREELCNGNCDVVLNGKRVPRRELFLGTKLAF